MAVSEGVVALREALGAHVVMLPEEFGDRRVEDWSGLPGAMPLAIIRPRDTNEVAAALAICARHAQPVVTQGGLTGLVGGANLLWRRGRAESRTHEPDRRNRCRVGHDDGRSRHAAAGGAGSGKRCGLLLSARSRRARQLLHRRKSGDECGRKPRHQVRHDARSGAGRGGGARRVARSSAASTR